MSKDILHELDRQSREQSARVRLLILEQGRPDILVEYDRNMKDIANGTSSARNCWHSISSKQRFVLRLMGRGFGLIRAKRNPNIYDAYGRGRAVLGVCQLNTVRKLCAHELCHVDGGALDPEARFVITERGQFVLCHGVNAPTESA